MSSRAWSGYINALDAILDLSPHILIPCHLFPLHGEDYIREMVEGHRDGIQFVHDQTIKLMNEGKNLLATTVWL